MTRKTLLATFCLSLAFVFFHNNTYANTQQTAKTISDEKFYTGKLTKNNKEMYYKFKLASKKHVAMYLSEDYIGQWNFELLNGNGEILYKTKTHEESLVYFYKVFVQTLPKGTYYLKITNNHDTYNKKFKTSIRILDYDHKEKENNNSLKKANSIRLNNNYTGSVDSYGQDKSDKVDYYKVKIPGKGRVTVSTSNMLGAEWTTDLLDSKGKIIDASYTIENDSANRKEAYEVSGFTSYTVGLKKGTYYVRIKGQGDEYPNYIFNVKFKKDAYIETEKNDTLKTANTIKIGRTYTGWYSDYADPADWYKFKATKATSHSLNLAIHPQSAIKVLIYNNKNQLVTYNIYENITKKIKHKKMTTKPLSKGTYYIRVEEFYGLPYIPYKLKVTTGR
ncbi:hypothetical protein ACQKND_22040 [Viridibacillus arvi]|uniref:hypothetical protein n=1 Tax=Viridibacillus arvi TaxID=263475 RepID=UPI003D02F3E9